MSRSSALVASDSEPGCFSLELYDKDVPVKTEAQGQMVSGSKSRTWTFRRILRAIAKWIPGILLAWHLLKQITRDAPMEGFDDYDHYWRLRKRDISTDWWHARYSYVIDEIQDGTRVLDLGCGDGGFLKYLSKARPNCEVLGADISAEAIAMVRRRGLLGVHIDSARPLREQVPPHFDYVVLMELLEHVVEAERLFRDVLALTPKYLFVSLPNMGYFVNRLRLLIGGRTPITNVFYHMREHVRFWSVKDFRHWADVMGCEVTGVFGQYGYSLALARRFPRLFASGVVYRIVPKNVRPENR